MKVRIFCRLAPVIAAFLFAYSCAKVSAPTGGPKDRTSPVVVKSVPENGVLNFTGKNIVITFNEFVVLEKINDKFMISPPLEKKPEIFLRGKNLNIEFKEDLRDSTTYTLYFQDAIRDITEGNTINNYQFVFSTGPFIDSLSTSGNVFNSYSLDPPENALILMHRVLADSAPLKLVPDYISRTDINGGFRINNIHEGEYRLYALTDDNNNRKYDFADEAFAFMNSTIFIDSVRNYLPQIVEIKDTLKPKPGVRQEAAPPLFDGEFKLYQFIAGKKDSYLTSSDRKFPYLLVYILSVPPDTSKIEFSIPGAGESGFYTEENKTRDTIKVWLTDSTLYSQAQLKTLFGYPFTDTTGKLVHRRDTITMRFLEGRSAQAKAKTKKSTYTFRTSLAGGSVKPGGLVVISSETPMRQPDTSKIRIFESVDTVRIKRPYVLQKDTANSCRYFMKTTLKPGSIYIFIADSASFGNIYGESCDSTGIRFTVRKTETFGKVIFRTTLENYTGKLFIELLDNKDNVVGKGIMVSDTIWEFSNIDKGRYRARAVFDLNGDGKWTTGDYENKRQPEPVSFYHDELEVKENWDLDNDWILKPENVKEQKLRQVKRQ